MVVPAALINVGRWGVALAAPAAAFAIAYALQPLIGHIPAPPFMAAILVVAWTSGFRPALLALALSVAVLDYFFMTPLNTWSLTTANALWFLVFAVVAAAAAWMIDSRARLQGRLRAGEQQLRLITDAAPTLICFVDTDRRYRFANRAFVAYLGRTREEVIGRRVLDVLGADAYAGVEGHLTAALAGRRTDFDVAMPGAEGPRHLHAVYVPDLGPHDAVRGVVAMVNDVTDRRRAEDERARRLETEQARRREAEAIAELGRIITQGLDLETVAQRIAEVSRGLLRAVTTTVYRVDPASQDFVCLAVSGDMGGFRPGAVLARGAGVVGRAVDRGRPVTSPNVLEDPEIDLGEAREWMERAPFRAVLAVPLQVKGRMIGAFAVGDRLGREFGADDVRVAEALADHAAMALENARLYIEADERRREAELMADLARTVNASLDLDTVLGRVTAAAKDLCNADLARIALWDADRQGMAFRYTVGTRAGEHGHVLLLPGKGLAGEVLATGRPVRTADVLGDPRLHPDYAEMIRSEGSVAVLVAPIRMGERVEGLLYVDNRAARPFSDRDETILTRLADHAAIGLRNAQLFAVEQAARGEAEARARRARLLADVSRALASSSDYEATLDAVTHLVVPAHADWCVVHLAEREGGAQRRVAVAYADAAHAALAAETVRLPPTADWLREARDARTARREARSVLLEHATPAAVEGIVVDGDDQRILLALQPRSLLVVPLVTRGRVLGAITWLRIAESAPYASEDLGLAEDIAARAAFAVDGARLFRQAEHARSEAESANQAKDEFLAVLSHELRTPLTSMLGWLRLLRAGQLGPDRVAQALEVLERNTRTQAQLINDLLDVSRIIAGKLQLDLYPVDLTPIVEEVVESVRRDAESKGVALELSTVAGPVSVLGDPLRLGQIGSNLVSNAVKFTPTGGRVQVRLVREAAEAVVTVTDTGIGIPPEMLTHVFDRFRQADSTITRRHGGLGLGLAIVRHLSELHGGAVRAQSLGEGQGSVFTVRLPLAGPEARRGRGEPATTVGAASTVPHVLAGVRVLVVEDHHDTAELLRAVLGSHGAQVRVAGSLAEALSALAEAATDVLLSDIVMPDGNGYELLHRLRERERATGRTPLPAVAVTAFAGGEDGDRARAAGFHDYAAKPIDPAALVDVIARAADRARS